MKTMKREECLAAQSQVLTLVQLLQELPLDAMAEAITLAHSAAPIVERQLGDIERIVGALRDAQAATRAPLANLRGWAALQLASSGQADRVDWEALAE